MKRKLHFLLAVSIGLTASVGWLHAENETHHVFHVGTIANKTGDVKGLRDSIAKAVDGDTIKLASVIYLLDEQLVIDKGIVLEGIVGSPDATMIKANRDAEWPKKTDGSIDNSKTNLISIVGGSTEKSVTLKDLVVFNSMASGINAQSAMKTCLEGVIIDGSMNAGLLVHSAVEVKSLKTLGNGWGSVNVDKGTSDYTPNFKFTDGNFQAYEPYKIWTELTSEANVVTLPENSKWATYTIKGSDKEKTKKYWTTSDLSMEYVENFPRNKNLTNGYTFVYAAGAPITVAASTNSGFVTILNNTTGTLLELPEKCNPVIFGGSKEALDKNTSITMESGKVFALIGGGYKAKVNDVALTVNGGTIRQYLVGGGFGPNDSKENAKSADATAVTMNVNGASVGYLISGGMEFSKVTSVKVILQDATISNALGGGFAPVGFDQSLTQTFENSLNRIESTTFEMTGGKVTSEIMLGGGYSFSYAKNVVATLDGVTFNGGLYGIGFNGFSDEVTATVNGCTFNKVNPDYNTIAAMVRGKAGKVSMTFDKNCKFDSQYECYLGADRDNEYNPAPMTENATFVFKGTSTPIVKVSEGMQNVTLTGAKVNVAPFLRQLSSSTIVNAFTIPSGKTWTFNDGLSMASGVTLTKTGTLKYGKSFEADVKTLAEMKNALEIVNAGDESITNTINLNADLAVPSDNTAWMAAFNDMGYFYRILKPVTINGNGKSISGTFPSDATKKYVITADYTGDKAIIINDLTIEKTNATALNITWPKNVILNNVTLNDNEAGGLNINSAKVKATNLQTSGNRAAVRIQHQNATTGTTPYFELVSGTLKDSVQIAFHNRTATTGETGVAVADYDALVKLPANDKYIKTWRKAALKAGKEAIVRVWTNRRLAEVKVGDNAFVTLDSISSGLDSLLVDMSFANVKGVMNTSVKSETLNGKDHKTGALRNGRIINCKDAYVVSGAKTAEEFAKMATNKTVLSLTVEGEKLVVAPLSSEQIISTSIEWNDAKYAKQNVRITEKGFLTINVPMELDTIFMVEGAQLEAKAAVTAKAVQLTYDVKKTWKAFGFPFTSLSVTNLKGEAVTTTADKEAATGLWTATIKDSEPVFEVTNSSATPVASCIIAADQDSTILVTSTTTGNALISLASKAEPNAPVLTKSGENVKFRIVSNPNTYDMQLTQTAYVLSADGKTFDRVESPSIPAFQSFVLADEGTTSTLRSLRIGDTPTGNEIIPTDGYYVQAGKGSITIRTAEPVQVTVVDMLGRVYYNARVNDGARIDVPAGIYAVNRQKVIVK